LTIDTPIHQDQRLAATHRAVWALGDYALMAEEVMAPLGPILVAATGMGVGHRVLDVAAGSGNTSLRAATTGATVISTDLTPELLQRSQMRAAQLGLTLEWQEANAHALPFPDGEFDIVMSAIGVMFAPDQRCAAGEMIRVCRTGGTIALISWTPDGFFGRMLATIRPYRPALSAAVPPAALWGREDYAVGLLGDRVTNISTRRDVLLVDRFQTAEDVHCYFKNHYGPTIEAFANIGDNGVLAAALDAQLIELSQEYLVDGSMDWEYLLLTAEKK